MRLADGSVNEVVLEQSLRHHLKGKVPDDLRISVRQSIDRDETHVMLTLNVYASHAISGLTASRMSKAQFINYAENGLRGSMMEMAKLLSDTAEQLREAAR